MRSYSQPLAFELSRFSYLETQTLTDLIENTTNVRVHCIPLPFNDLFLLAFRHENRTPEESGRWAKEVLLTGTSVTPSLKSRL